MKLKYESPEIKLIKFSVCDIVKTSLVTDWNPDENELPLTPIK